MISMVLPIRNPFGLAFYLKYFPHRSKPTSEKVTHSPPKAFFGHYLCPKTYFSAFRETLILNNPPWLCVDFTSPGIRPSM